MATFSEEITRALAPADNTGLVRSNVTAMLTTTETNLSTYIGTYETNNSPAPKLRLLVQERLVDLARQLGNELKKQQIN